MTRRRCRKLPRAMLQWMVLLGFCSFIATATGMAPVLAAGEIYIGPDEPSVGHPGGDTTDSVIRVGPSDATRSGSRIYMDRNLDSGDRVIHVVPPPEEDPESDVRIGPVLIIPEVGWPPSGLPPSGRPPDRGGPDQPRKRMVPQDQGQP